VRRMSELVEEEVRVSGGRCGGAVEGFTSSSTRSLLLVFVVI